MYCASGNSNSPAQIGRRNIRFARDQRGAVTLILSIVLLILTSLVAAYTGAAVLFERKVSSNEFRSSQAFEAAESGLTSALAYLGSRGGADKDGDGNIDPVFDTDGDGVGNVSVDNYGDGSSVTVTVTGTFPNFDIVAVGVSDDRTATRTIRSTGTTVDGLPNSPDNPVTARGSFIVNGSATVHNPEGASTIWAGDSVDLGSNNSTATNIADPNDAGYPSCMDYSMTCGTTRSSSKVAVGLDVIENDSSLTNLSSAEMFQNFFGTSMANYRDSRVTLEVAAANVNNLASNDAAPGIDLAAGEIVWVEGNTSLNGGTVGCEVSVTGANVCPNASLDPSILIINGDLDTSGSPTFYGVVYVIGEITGNGNVTANGAVIIGGAGASDPSGSWDIWYNSDVLNASRDNGPLAGGPGTWRDW